MSQTNTTKNVAYINRLHGIDILRGLALLIMTLDHTRDFFGALAYSDADLAHATPWMFFSRWITHLCAPTFVFLAGVSAYLYGLKHTRTELSRFLLTRGAWLIFLELTVITFSWKFTLDATLVVQVIYVLGISMMMLAGLIWLPKPIVFVISLATIIGQSFLTAVTPTEPLLAHLWTFIYGFGSFDLGQFNVTVFYSIIPWTAVMSLGYLLGSWFKLPDQEQGKRFMLLGVMCLSAFAILRYVNVFGNPTLWITGTGFKASFFSFINVTKYPASLQFLLLMLGIMFCIYPLIAKWNNKASDFVLTFGKVSLFYYIIHLYIIHLIAYAYSYLILGAHPEWWWGNSAWITNHYPTPANYHFSLIRVYFVTMLVILISYPLCFAYGRYKSRHKYPFLSYI